VAGLAALAVYADVLVLFALVIVLREYSTEHVAGIRRSTGPSVR
jgi:hypothetical protein